MFDGLIPHSELLDGYDTLDRVLLIWIFRICSLIIGHQTFGVSKQYLQPKSVCVTGSRATASILCCPRGCPKAVDELSLLLRTRLVISDSLRDPNLPRYQIHLFGSTHDATSIPRFDSVKPCFQVENFGDMLLIRLARDEMPPRPPNTVRQNMRLNVRASLCLPKVPPRLSPRASVRHEMLIVAAIIDIVDRAAVHEYRLVG